MNITIFIITMSIYYEQNIPNEALEFLIVIVNYRIFMKTIALVLTPQGEALQCASKQPYLKYVNNFFWILILNQI